MGNLSKKTINTFLINVLDNVEDGLEYRDAVQLVAVSMDIEIARLVSSAISKYQEATYSKTELSCQPNVDECALASMGKLWHGENFEGNSEQMDCTLEETFLDALYLILKYAKFNNPLEDALSVNESICGDIIARKAIIESAFSK